MAASGPKSTADGLSPNAEFPATHWSAVLAADDSQSARAADALAQLCRSYWYPLYCYVRRLGHGPEDAQDLTQEFFARVLEKRYLKTADPAKGKFRSFLLVVLKGFLANEWDRANRQKRGCGCHVLSLDANSTETRFLAEPADDATPERAFEMQWAMALLTCVLDALEQEFARTGRGELFTGLKLFLTGEDEKGAYAAAAARLGMSEGSVRVAVSRLRQRYRELLRAEIAHTVARPEDIDDEIRNLFAALRG